MNIFSVYLYLLHQELIQAKQISKPQTRQPTIPSYLLVYKVPVIQRNQKSYQIIRHQCPEIQFYKIFQQSRPKTRTRKRQIKDLMRKIEKQKNRKIEKLYFQNLQQVYIDSWLEMKISIICILLITFAYITKSFMITADKTSNVTSSELTNIYKTIAQAQNIYQQTQLNNIAKYIFTKLRTIYQVDLWSTYVYAQNISRVTFIGIPDLGKYLWRMNYGKYNLTYVMWRTCTCQKQGAGGAVAQFGQSVNDTLKDKILQTVNNSILYRGDNMDGAAEYISEKLGTAYRGGWTVVISYPTVSFGFYQCRVKELWANLRQFADFKWSYYMSRGGA